jgi:hypothetical protein
MEYRTTYKSPGWVAMAVDTLAHPAQGLAYDLWG